MARGEYEDPITPLGQLDASRIRMLWLIAHATTMTADHNRMVVSGGASPAARRAALAQTNLFRMLPQMRMLALVRQRNAKTSQGGM